MAVISEIQMGKRYRKTVGKLDSLKESISAVGLLHPIVITSEKKLIAGERRLAACKELGWKDIPATTLDLSDMLRGQCDENFVRMHFQPSEMVAIGEALEAKERLPGRPKKNAGNLPAFSKGDTRDKVATRLGVSGKTYEKAKAVVASGDKDLISRMDETGKVDKAYKQLRDNQAKEKRREQYRAAAKSLPKRRKENIIVGDFRKHSDKIPDGSLSLIFTDPPYDREAADLLPALAAFAAAKLAEGGSLIAYIAHINLRQAIAAFDAKLRYWWILCCLHSGQSVLMREYGIRADWKPVLWYVKKTRDDTQNIVSDVMSGGREKDIHDWQQAESEAAYWIEKLCPPDGVVCDPFLGGGTTAAAAEKVGRKWVGYEIDPDVAGAAYGRVFNK